VEPELETKAGKGPKAAEEEEEVEGMGAERVGKKVTVESL